MQIYKFTTKLNKLDNNIYSIEEEITVVNGKYKGFLEHDNVNINSLNVYTGSKLTGEKINSYILSTPSETPWKTEIELYTKLDTVYITYETVGDTIEAEDINILQDSIVYVQEEFNKYQKSNDNKVSELVENKVDKVQGKQLSTNDYTNAEKDKLSNIEENANRYIHPNDSNIRHVTDAEKDIWNSKETVEGSQAKSTKALNDAKSYTNTKINDLIGGEINTYNTLKKIEDAIKNHELEYSDLLTVVNKKADLSHNHDSVYLGKNDNSVSATKLQTARTINGVAFDGTRNITIQDSTKVSPTGTIVANRIPIFSDTTGKVIKDSGFTIATSVPSGAKFTDTVYTHPNDSNTRHVTDSEKSTWNAKETTTGAQQKADAALASAKSYTDIKVASFVDSAPETLDTLNELATALGNDPNFATTVSNKIGTKADTTYVNQELGKKANTSHNQAANTITAMTGYSKPSSTSAIATTDSLNAAIGKLEKALDGKQASGSYAASSHTHNYAGSSSAGGAANSANTLATARTINGTSFNGSANITTANWGTARTITIGNTGKSVNGSANVSWSLSEIGAAAASHGRHMSDTCETITDWNNATKNGWYMGNNAANGPRTVASGGTIWYFGEVITHNTNYVIQVVYQFTASTDAKSIPKYIRAKTNGTWGAWTNVTVSKAVPSNAVFTDTNTWRGVQDNLTSTATDQSLSANQGRVLKGMIDGKANSSHNHTKSQISDFPTKLSQFEDDLGIGQLPSKFTWNMLKGV